MTKVGEGRKKKGDISVNTISQGGKDARSTTRHGNTIHVKWRKGKLALPIRSGSGAFRERVFLVDPRSMCGEGGGRGPTYQKKKKKNTTDVKNRGGGTATVISA